jgi:FG-GAP-like repeat/Calx-beta domain
MATFLQEGDIAFSAFQSDDSGGGFNGDAFEFVLLVPVEAGTDIYFTDNGYLTNTSAFRTTENLIRWKAPSNLPAGSVVNFTVPGGSIGVGSTLQWTGINPVTGSPLNTATLLLSASGDNITALTSPTFGGADALNGFPIAALTFGGSTFSSPFTTVSGTNTTGLPLGLVDGTTAVSVGSTQNGRYNDAATGSVESGSRNAIRSSLNNDAYWTVSADPLPTPFNTTATFSITTVSIAATDATATEAPGDTGTFRITRTGDTTAALSVGLGIGGEATDGVDYTGVPSSVTIAAGASFTDITVTPIQDSLPEPDETVFLLLAGGGNNYTVANPASATVTISNSAFVPLPTVTISAINETASEAGSNPGVFRITRTGGGGAGMPLTVNYSVSGSATTADYTPTLGTSATILANQTFVDVTINPVDDALVEGPETVNLTLAAGSYTTLASPSANFATVSISDNDVRPNDFNGDGKSDILWRNDNGTIATWQMDGTVSPASLHIGVAPNDWKIAGTGDFNGDGKSDILWRHDGGIVAVWKDGLTINPTTLNIGAAPIDWKIAGTGDFNGDGKSDILWRHDGGTVAVWKDGLTINPTTLNIGAAPIDWKIAGTGDFDGDGKSDILWRHDGGTVAIWQNGITASPSVHIGANSMDWKITGTADFNGDGKSDILWRNDDGTVAIWQMNGITASPSVHIGANTNDWKIAGTLDYNADNKSDILWRHDSGTTAVWQMDGISANPLSIHIGIPPGAAPDWQIAGSPQTYAPPLST